MSIMRIEINIPLNCSEEILHLKKENGKLLRKIRPKNDI